ncbi:MAG: energy transducer TonB [Steroidobacteraceae bacterium]
MVLHLAVLALLLLQRAVLPAAPEPLITASLIGPSHEQAPAAPRPLRPPDLLQVPPPLVLATSVTSISLRTEAAPATAVPAAAPGGPVGERLRLGEELAVLCPQRTPPEYPLNARRLRIEGTVTLRVELDAGGRVATVRVAQSSGSPLLDEAAIAAVSHWQCQPAQRDGVPVAAVALQPLQFVLRRR